MFFWGDGEVGQENPPSHGSLVGRPFPLGCLWGGSKVELCGLGSEKS